MNRTAILLLVVCIIALIGYFSVTGFYLKTAEEIAADKAIKSATLWLNTEEGSARFPNGIAAGPMPIYAGNTTDILYWIVPIKNSEGLYLGMIVTELEEFDRPTSDLKFAEPREFLFYISKDEAYSQMIAEHPEYSAGQITEPRLVYDKGQYWMSEVLENGQVIDVLYVSARSN